MKYEEDVCLVLREAMWDVVRQLNASSTDLGAALDDLEVRAQSILDNLRERAEAGWDDADLELRMSILAAEASVCRSTGVVDGAAGRLASAYRGVLACLDRLVVYRQCRVLGVSI